jgi:hypothetical protein
MKNYIGTCILMCTSSYIKLSKGGHNKQVKEERNQFMLLMNPRSFSVLDYNFVTQLLLVY